MLCRTILIAFLAVVILTSAGFGQTGGDNPRDWLTTEQILAGGRGSAEAGPPAKRGKSPASPFQTIEGVGGYAITPMAYLSNPGVKGTTRSLPSVSFTYVQAGSKSLQTLAITETFYQRIELGYAVSRFYMGSLPHVIRRDMGMDIDRNDVYLHNFNIRAMLVEEDSHDLALPAITAGVHFKYNDGIRSIDDRMGGALGAIGFERSNGVDFVITASKTFPDVLFGKTLIASVGLRNSQASQLGYLGFSDDWSTTLEANVVCLVRDSLVLGYEFRQKGDPYGQIPGVIGDEDDWHAISAGWIVNEHLSILAGWGYLGTLANSEDTNTVILEVKYEF